MPEGTDISEHQATVPDGDFVIIRAFNENGYPDRLFAQHWAEAKRRGIPRGAYGWPVPGTDNRALGAQLVRTAPDAEAGYWADVEHSGRGIASASDVEEYLRGIGDRPRGFYSNIGECPRSPMLDAEQWWMADYGPNDGQRYDPNAQPPRPARPWVIHQYTSAGGLDRNYSDDLAWTGDDNMGLSLADYEWLQNNVAGVGIDGQTKITNRMILDAVLALAARIDALETGGDGAPVPLKVTLTGTAEP